MGNPLLCFSCYLVKFAGFFLLFRCPVFVGSFWCDWFFRRICVLRGDKTGIYYAAIDSLSAFLSILLLEETRLGATVFRFLGRLCRNSISDPVDWTEYSCFRHSDVTVSSDLASSILLALLTLDLGLDLLATGHIC